MKVTVLVRPKRRASSTRRARRSTARSQALGYAGRGVRAGKTFDLELDAADRGAADAGRARWPSGCSRTR